MTLLQNSPKSLRFTAAFLFAASAPAAIAIVSANEALRRAREHEAKHGPWPVAYLI